MPSSEDHGIDLTIIGSKDGNEGFTPQSREWIVRRISRCTKVHTGWIGMRYAHHTDPASISALNTCAGCPGLSSERSPARVASCPRLLQAAAIRSAIKSKHLTYPHPLYYPPGVATTRIVFFHAVFRMTTDTATIPYTATATPSDVGGAEEPM